ATRRKDECPFTVSDFELIPPRAVSQGTTPLPPHVQGCRQLRSRNRRQPNASDQEKSQYGKSRGHRILGILLPLDAELSYKSRCNYHPQWQSTSHHGYSTMPKYQFFSSFAL